MTKAPLLGQSTSYVKQAPERFRSLLFDNRGDDDGGTIKMSVLRQTALNRSYYRADRAFISELTLNERFYHIPEWLYFGRDHQARAARAFRSVHGRCVPVDTLVAGREGRLL